MPVTAISTPTKLLASIPSKIESPKVTLDPIYAISADEQATPTKLVASILSKTDSLPVTLDPIHAISADEHDAPAKLMASIPSTTENLPVTLDPILDISAGEQEDPGPPDDYRKVIIHPTSTDLLSGARPYLRSIITEGPYDSAEHYLDVNFRLLREDLIQPIRDGLWQFRRRPYEKVIAPEPASEPWKPISLLSRVTEMVANCSLASGDATGKPMISSNLNHAAEPPHQINNNASYMAKEKLLIKNNIENDGHRLIENGGLSIENGSCGNGIGAANGSEHSERCTLNGGHPSITDLESGSDSWPLRNGTNSIASSRSNSTITRKEKQLNVYRNVRLIRISGIPGHGLVHRVSFNRSMSKLQRVDWALTKRLLTGSLVLLSFDNFRTFLLAVVVVRKVCELAQGIVVLKMQKDTRQKPESTIEFNTTYVMVESPSYYEAYSYFLRGLQQMDTHSLPFSKYLVEVSRHVDPPKYLNRSSECNLECFRGDNRSDKSLICKFLDQRTWPSAQSLHLDDAQYQALHIALTHELALIQGPPGTGKTYLGLKIVNVLLDSHIDVGGSETADKPILVMCHTNHALDQFLEGTLAFCSNGVVRVGGRSKSDSLESFTLHSIKHQMRQTRQVPYQIHRARVALLDKMRQCSLNMDQWRRMLVDSRKRVMDAAELSKLMQSNFFEQFMHNTALYSSLDELYGLTEWLGLANGNTNDNREEQLFVQCEPKETTIRRGGWNIAIDDILAQKKKDFPIVDDFDREAASLNEPTLHSPFSNKLIFSTEDESFDATGIIFDEFQCSIPTPQLDSQWHLDRRIANLLHSGPAFLKEEAEQVVDVWQLSLDNRWQLYRYWLTQFQSTCRLEIDAAQSSYEELSLSFIELDIQQDAELLSKARIIGMTTTGAAKYRKLLQSVAPRVVVVEEAAEVLEANLLATLNANCQHLILIGDQQQLRPHTSVHHLNLKYNFDVSLFERLVNNDIHNERLVLQYRMRPDISNLLVPHIYPKLNNHPSVCSYPDVAGVATNVYFLNHSLQESNISDSTSKCNYFEAEYLVHFCNYLVQQGHPPSHITILATYVGQLFVIKKNMMRFAILQDVHCTVVDSYQGKENEIILLSLVRSNDNNTVGFLKTDNRVCVALSRAKRGLYCLGNFDLLVANADIWRDIIGSLEPNIQIGTAIKLRCPNHPEIITEVSSVDDFVSKVSEGGCEKSCETVLSCGHICPLRCHSYDVAHIFVLCVKTCEKTCKFGHRCVHRCSLPCGLCIAIVDRVLPCEHTKPIRCSDNHITNCVEGCQCALCFCECEIPVTSCLKGHYTMVGCSQSDAPYWKPEQCSAPCPEILSCGHQCPGTCAQACGMLKCTVELIVQCPKGHQVKLPCHQNIDDVCIESLCTVDAQLPCGHAIKAPCCEVDNEGILSNLDDCNEYCCFVEVVGHCESGHKVLNVPCYQANDQDAINSLCRKLCLKKLACGHSCRELCGDECTDECLAVVMVESLCGHDVSVPCGQSQCKKVLMANCKVPCEQVLSCGHICSGTCIDCHQGRMHTICNKLCNRTQVCGHVVSVACGLVPQPCMAKCDIQCYHRRCRRRCCVECKPCQEPCRWSCQHHQCSKLCGEPCDRPACAFSCRRLLPCGHQCIGYCGEPCPRLCRVCTSDSVWLVFCGTLTGKSLSQFVLLQNCGHVIENGVLDSLMKEVKSNVGPTEPGSTGGGRDKPSSVGNSFLVRIKSCPVCNASISQNLRYGNQVKQTLAMVAEVKRRIFAEFEALQQYVRYSALHRDINQILQCQPPDGTLDDSFRELARDSKLNRFRIYHINLIKNKMSFLQTMTKLYNKIKDAPEPDFLREQLLALESWLLKLDGRQEKYGEHALVEFARELTRISYLYQLEVNSPKSVWGTPLYTKIYDTLTSLLPFSLHIERVVKAWMQKLNVVGADSSDAADAGIAVVTVQELDIKKTLILNSGQWFHNGYGKLKHCSAIRN